MKNGDRPRISPFYIDEVFVSPGFTCSYPPSGAAPQIYGHDANRLTLAIGPVLGHNRASIVPVLCQYCAKYSLDRQVRRMKKTDVTVISEIVNKSDEGLSSVAIYTALKKRMGDDVPSYRTFKRRLAALVEEGVIARSGKARAVKYRRPDRTPAPVAVDEARLVIPISGEGRAVQEYVRPPVAGPKAD